MRIYWNIRDLMIGISMPENKKRVFDSDVVYYSSGINDRAANSNTYKKILKKNAYGI